ncbi:head-tail adaptor protein [Staphylococcus kloosii]|uniref:head-tail adaptor protein n=1 Tax=Staphylococcus kloosii TaxID=29384 RepID=UPI00189EC95C|nr:head-tail adaptor protein [Staphylococcus kloosii]MBF7025928.1 head-tail adaptor protein [Staphylococcus kloosii]
MRMNNLKDYVEFFDVTDNGPEAGMGTTEKVFEAFAEIYEPSAKDVQLGNLELDKTNVTVIIRNSYPEFTPRVNQTFKVISGLYGGQSFNIKNVALKDATYFKIVGESDGN